MQQQNQSEVARMMAQIREENIAAKRVFQDPAMVGGHEFIERRTVGSAEAILRLVELVGSDEANRLTDLAFESDLEIHIRESFENGDFDGLEEK